MYQAIREELEHPLPQLLTEIDEHVATEDQVHLTERVIADQVMLEKMHVLFECRTDRDAPVSSGPVAVEVLLAACCAVVLFEILQQRLQVDPFARLLDRGAPFLEPAFRTATDSSDPWSRSLMKVPASLADLKS